MSGHHPISKLFEKLTPEDRQHIKAMTDEILADIERREAQTNGSVAQKDISEISEEAHQHQPAQQ